MAGAQCLSVSKYVPRTESLAMLPTLAPQRHDGATLKGTVSGSVGVIVGVSGRVGRERGGKEPGRGREGAVCL